MHDSAASLSMSRTELDYPEVAARGDQLPALRHALADWALGHGLEQYHIDALTLATYEALANVVTHAYPDGETGTLTLRARYEPEQHHLEVTVTDHGRWEPPPREPGPLGGRGVPLMQGLAEHADIQPGEHGTTVRLHWTVPQPATDEVEAAAGSQIRQNRG